MFFNWRSILWSMLEGGLLCVALELYARHHWWSITIGVVALTISWTDGRNGWSKKLDRRASR